jgi:hypothetical protein
MSSNLLVSCLCVTENRSPFMPWLLWSYDRQTWQEKELLVIDSSAEPLPLSRPDVRVVRAPAGAGIMEKRAIALRELRGQALAWFDDDDWQHPERLARLATAIGSGALIAGAPHTWFVDLFSARCRPHVEPGKLFLFNAAGYSSDLACSPPSIERMLGPGSETDWTAWVQHQAAERAALLSGPPLTALLCHSSNTLNQSSRWQFDEALEAFEADVGTSAWADTGEHLEALRSRLATAPPPPRTPIGQAAPNGNRPRRTRARGGLFQRR